MKFGLSDKNWKIIEDILINPLNSSGVRVWLFGSRARGDYEEFSDADFLVSSPVNARFLSEIRYALVGLDRE